MLAARWSAALSSVALTLAALSPPAPALGGVAGTSAAQGHEHHAAPAPAEGARFTRSLAAYRPPAVELVDAAGRAVALADLLAGYEPVMLQFIFTTCPGACPALSGLFAAAQDRLVGEAGGALAGVRLVSISIDAEHDTPQRLADYARRFGAGPRWTFLTGSRDDVLAVQRAFDADRGGKMRHEPVTFLRAPGGGAQWVRLDGFPSPEELVAEARRLAGGELGRRLYQDGLRASGEPLAGIALGGAVITGSCASCHRPSGFGALEGGAAVPAVTGEALFGGGRERRADLFRRLYLEPGPPGLLAAARAAPARPAYTVESLGRALAQGVDSAGRALDLLMPRYALEEGEVAALAAYLAGLGGGPESGVDRAEIHLATVVAPGVDPGRRRDHLGVLEAYVERHNRDVGNLLARPGASPHHRDDFAVGYRRWRLHVWELAGPPEAWRAQLAARFAARPVLALVGGLGAGTWRPVHDFCEAQAVPCLFAQVPLPPPGEDRWALYHDRGLPGEAAVLAQSLAEREAEGWEAGLAGARGGEAAGGAAGARGVEAEPGATAPARPAPAERSAAAPPGPIVQVWRQGDAVGEAAAASFRAALPPRLASLLLDRPLAAGSEPDAAFWRRLIEAAAAPPPGPAGPSGTGTGPGGAGTSGCVSAPGSASAPEREASAGSAGASGPAGAPGREGSAGSASAPGPSGAPGPAGPRPGGAPATLVLWLERWPSSLPAELAPRLAAVHLSYRLLGEALPPVPGPLAGKLRLTWPYALPGAAPPDAHRVHAWLRSRRLPPGDDRLRLATWWTAAVLDHALAHMVDRFDRAWLIERVEHEAELVTDPGVYPAPSLGPGQRVASKGSWIVRLDPSAPGGVAPVGPWRRAAATRQ